MQSESRQTLEMLRKEFAIGGVIGFDAIAEDYPVMAITSPLCSAKIALRGGHIYAFVPAGGEDLLFVSKDTVFAPGKAIRGGIPVCWPWFGAHPEKNKPSHGFARTALWKLKKSELLDDGSVGVVLSLEENEATKQLWPYDFDLELSFKLAETLSIYLKTTNRADTPMAISQALHTYFSVSDIASVWIEGLDGCRYLDTLADVEGTQAGSVVFEGEFDRIYSGVPKRLIIHDKGRKIVIASEQSGSSIVWNPWIEKSRRLGDMEPEGYRRMVCLESANVLDDAFSLQPGESRTLSVTYMIG